MNKRVQAIIAAFARQGIAADFARMNPRLEEDLAAVHLRFDRVALRFVHDVQSSLDDVVPDGKTLMFTITAPIRQAAKTAALLEKKVRDSRARATARLDLEETIHGNRIRARLLAGGVAGAAKAIGFVHNPDSDPDALFDAAQSLLRFAMSLTTSRE